MVLGVFVVMHRTPLSDSNFQDCSARNRLGVPQSPGPARALSLAAGCSLFHQEWRAVGDESGHWSVAITKIWPSGGSAPPRGAARNPSGVAKKDAMIKDLIKCPGQTEPVKAAPEV